MRQTLSDAGGNFNAQVITFFVGATPAAPSVPEPEPWPADLTAPGLYGQQMTLPSGEPAIRFYWVNESGFSGYQLWEIDRMAVATVWGVYAPIGAIATASTIDSDLERVFVWVVPESLRVDGDLHFGVWNTNGPYEEFFVSVALIF